MRTHSPVSSPTTIAVPAQDSEVIRPRPTDGIVVVDTGASAYAPLFPSVIVDVVNGKESHYPLPTTHTGTSIMVKNYLPQFVLLLENCDGMGRSTPVTHLSPSARNFATGNAHACRLGSLSPATCCFITAHKGSISRGNR